MYGWLHACMEDLVISKYGSSIWESILLASGINMETGDFLHSVNYSDRIFYSLVETAMEILDLPHREVLFEFGEHFVNYIAKLELDQVLLCGSRSMREWLRNIGEPHRLMRAKFPTADLPEFRLECMENDPTVAYLHYYTTKTNYWEPIVEGLCCRVSNFYFGAFVMMSITVSEQLETLHHTCWKIENLTLDSPSSASHHSKNPPAELSCPFSAKLAAVDANNQGNPSSSVSAQNEVPNYDVGISSRHLKTVSPFHLSVNHEFKIVQAGKKIDELFSSRNIKLLGTPISNLFQLSPEGCVWTWPCLSQLEGTSITLVCVSTTPIMQFSGELIAQTEGLLPTMTFLLRPDCYRFEELEELGVNFLDLPIHSCQRDVIVAGETIKSEVDYGKKIKEMGRKLAKQSAVVKQALKTKQIFVRYVSHEIRTPMNIAALGLGYLDEKLDPEVKSKSEIKDTLDEIRASCSIAVEILNDFLLYEKMDDGIFNLSLARLFVAPIIEESSKLFDIQAKINDIRFESNIPEEVQTIEVVLDRKKFYQVLRNLLSNAIKFTSKGGCVSLTAYVMATESFSSRPYYDHNPICFASFPDLTTAPNSSDQSVDLNDRMRNSSVAECSSVVSDCPQSVTSNATMLFDMPKIDSCDRFLRIVVSDTGAGISGSDQNSLFNQFFQIQADKLQRGQGSGLGLWIASNIVHQHGGRIGVMSAGEGLGSHFIVDLPIYVSSMVSRPVSSLLSDNDIASSLLRDKCMIASSSSSIGGVANGQVSEITTARTVDSAVPAVSAVLSNPSVDSSPRQALSSSNGKNLQSDLYLTSYPGHPSLFLPQLPSSLLSLFEDETLTHALRSVSLKEARILIVDDAVSNRKMMRRIFQGKFCHMDEAENGLQALEKFIASWSNPVDTRPYDIIFMDGVMPEMDGLTATSKIREFQFVKLTEHLRNLQQLLETPCLDQKSSFFHRTLILGVTGNGQDEDMKRFVDAGADHVFVKPINMQSLLDYLDIFFIARDSI